MPITKAAVWCPRSDAKFEATFRNMKIGFKAKDLHEHMLGRGQLNQLDPGATLYILAHSHGALAMFYAAGQDWTGEGLAALIQSDLLSINHRNIVLLVCNAAWSVNTDVGVARIRRVQEQHTQAKQRGDVQAAAALELEYNRLSALAPKPAAYTRPAQTLPLAGALMTAMIALGYRSLAIVSYARPVAQYFGNKQGKEIQLDLPPVKPAFDHPELTVTWRRM